MPDAAGRMKALTGAAVHRLRLEPVAMSTRIMNTIVHFSAPFALPDIDDVHPAGDYKILQDEEPIEGLSRPARRPVATFICLPSIAAGSRGRRAVKIDPGLLRHLLATTNSSGELSS
jgi:hypothetical protein